MSKVSKRQQINVSLNDDDVEVIEKLKKIYGINVSAIVKLGIRKLLTEDGEVNKPVPTIGRN